MTTIIGSADNNKVMGTPDADTITGLGGNDTLNGLAGADDIDGGEGNDWLTGGEGNDSLYGGTGNDRLTDYDDLNSLYGGDGNDTITAFIASGDQAVDGGAGDDSISLYMFDLRPGSNVTLTGGTGKDTFVVANPYIPTGNRILTDFVAGAGGDVLNLNAFVAALTDYSGGNPFGTGHLRLFQSGADTLLQVDLNGAMGGTAYQTLLTFANVQSSALIAENFAGIIPDGTAMPGEVITGTALNDTLTGTVGHDTMMGLGGIDSLDGGVGQDSIDGGDGNDWLSGGNGHDSLYGGAGNDRLTDYDGLNNLYGGDGNDTITAFIASGDQTVDGGAGDDAISLYMFDRPGSNVSLTGGAGRDTYVIATTSVPTGTRVVTDFAVGDSGDIIDLNTFVTGFSNYSGGNPFSTGHLRLVQSGADTLLEADLDGAGSALFRTLLTLQNIQVSALTAANFGGLGPDGALQPGQAIAGTSAPDSLKGTVGDDTITGLTGGDTIEGLVGNDSLDGGIDQDWLYGGDGNDNLYGGAGHDQLIDYDGLNALYGGDGNDTITAFIASGNQTVDGGAGEDTIALYMFDRAGSNVTVAGGSGMDVFVIATSAVPTGERLITDFTAGFIPHTSGDIIDLNGVIAGLSDYSGGNPFATGHFRLIESGGNTLLQVDRNGAVGGAAFATLLTLQNVRANTLTAGNLNGLASLYSEPGVSLTGTDGVDTLKGGAGNDTIDGLMNLDTIDGFGGDDILSGSAGNDVLRGGDGNDTLIGGNDEDLMMGGAGDDTYYVERMVDKVVEIDGEGNDRIIVTRDYLNWSMNSDVEALEFRSVGNVTGTGNNLNNLIIGNGGNNTLTGEAGNDTLDGGLGADSLDGGQGDDSLLGGARWDTLRGADGNDTLDGGIDNDAMYGGAGNDLYYVDNTGDRTFESAGEGTDSVISSISLALMADVENLTLTGAAATGTGNGLANRIVGNDGANTLSGGASADTLDGGAGADSLDGGIGNDSLLGGARWDTLMGGDGNDTLDGGLDNDQMYGGLGDDVYYVDHAGDRVNEATGDNQGFDTVYASITWNMTANIETVVFTGSVDASGTGNSLHNTMTGNAGNNTLSGGTGHDTINGGDGNDLLNGETDSDVLDGGNGNDTLVGGQRWDTLIGGAGDDVLNGGTENDRMTGNAGNDSYFVDHIGDRVFEVAGEGNDTVYSTIDWVMANEIEALVLQGSAVTGTGNGLANRISGTSGANILSGGNGNDTLTGGAGDDTLTGGTGRDDFVFGAPASTGADHITDFVHAIDRLVFKGADYGFAAGYHLTSAQFTLGASAVGTGAQFGWDAAAGHLWWDADGTGIGSIVDLGWVDGAPGITKDDLYFTA